MTTRRTLIRTLLAAPLFSLISSKSSGRPVQTSVAGPLDSAAVTQLLKQFNVPGVSVAVVKDFKIDWAQGHGIADVETGSAVTTETLKFRSRWPANPIVCCRSQ